MILTLIKYQFLKNSHGKYDPLKQFIEYDDNNIVCPLCLRLSKMTGYIRKLDEYKNRNKNTITIIMSLKVNDK